MMLPPPPPGPRGAGWGTLNHRFWQADPRSFLATLVARHGDIVGFDLGRAPCILVNGAAAVRTLFTACEPFLHKPDFVKDSNRGHWGDGLTTLEDDAWRAHRRLLRPAFRPALLNPHLALVAHCTEAMLDSWGEDGRIDLGTALRLLTARIAVRRALDAEVDGLGPAAGRAGVVPVEEAVGEDYTGTAGGDPEAPLAMTRPRAPRRMDAVIGLVDARIASGEDRGDILSALVHGRAADGSRLDREAILGEVIQLLYSGHLTIPLSLVNAWHDVAEHGIGGRLAGEAAALCAAGIPSTAALAESYGMAVLKESLRLRPPAPFLFREVARPFELGGFGFAAGTMVWASPLLLHHDPRHFATPDRFLPERFGASRGAAAPPGAYLPFGIGARQCIAMQSALHQMAMVILAMARRVSIVPLHDGDVRSAATPFARRAMFRFSRIRLPPVNVPG